MKNAELYNKTVGILVDAYMVGKLRYSDCSVCAVGNIVAGNMGCEPRGGITDKWGMAVIMGTGKIDTRNITNEAIKQINITGYSVQEIVDIEMAFAKGTGLDPFRSIDEVNFDGLCAVIDCLDKIHENTDTELTTTSKKRFNKSLINN